MQLLLMHIDFQTHKNWFRFIINEQDYLPSKKNQSVKCKLHRSLKAFKSDECKESRWSVLKRNMQEF